MARLQSAGPRCLADRLRSPCPRGLDDPRCGVLCARKEQPFTATPPRGQIDEVGVLSHTEHPSRDEGILQRERSDPNRDPLSPEICLRPSPARDARFHKSYVSPLPRMARRSCSSRARPQPMISHRLTGASWRIASRAVAATCSGRTVDDTARPSDAYAGFARHSDPAALADGSSSL